MTIAEKKKMKDERADRIRLSCQIVCDHDITVRAINRLTGSGPLSGPTQEPLIHRLSSLLGSSTCSPVRLDSDQHFGGVTDLIHQTDRGAPKAQEAN
jgi:hypothetical protein